MSTVWISSSSDSDSDLPSFNHIICKKKSSVTFNSNENDPVCSKDVADRSYETKNDKNDFLCILTSEEENDISSNSASSCSESDSNCISNKSKKVSSSDDNKENCSSEKIRSKCISAQSESSEIPSINVFKPEECIKHLTCYISSSIIHIFKNEDIISTLKATSSAMYATCSSDQATVKWQCSTVLLQQPHWNDEEFKHSNRQLFAFEASEFRSNVNDQNEPFVTHLKLESFLESNVLEQTAVVLVCVGLNKYKRSLQRKIQKDYKKKVLQQQNISDKTLSQNVTIENIEEYFVALYLKYNVDVIPIENENEFVLLLSQITKAISETPFKKKQRHNSHFANCSGSIKIDAKTGQGSKAVWKQMLEQLFNVSSDISSAIVAEYPSLKSLMLTYQSLPQENGSLLLSELQIRRGFGTLQQSRRLGPELSKKVYRFFTSTDGDEVI